MGGNVGGSTAMPTPDTTGLPFQPNPTLPVSPVAPAPDTSSLTFGQTPSLPTPTDKQLAGPGVSTGDPQQRAVGNAIGNFGLVLQRALQNYQNQKAAIAKRPEYQDNLYQQMTGQ